MHAWIRTLVLHLVLLFVSTSIALFAVQIIGNELYIPWDSSIHVGKLTNGLFYGIMPNYKPEGRISLRLLVDVGSLDELDHQRGLAHFLEHMAFRGSKNFPPNTAVAFFQRLGMSFGEDTNAHTSTEETLFKLDLASNDTAHVSEGLAFMLDLAQNLELNEAEVVSERGVILAETKDRDSAVYRKAVTELAFTHPEALYNERLPIGLEEVVRNATSADLRQFYETWYRPDNMYLAVVGDMNVSVVKAEIEKIFSQLDSNDSEMPEAPDIGTFCRNSPAFEYYSDNELPTPVLDITSCKQTAKSTLHTRHSYRAPMLYAAAVSILNRRLAVLSEQADSAVLHAAAHASFDDPDYSSVMIQVQAAETEWKEALSKTMTVVKHAAANPIQEWELNDVRSEIINQQKRSVAEKSNRHSGSLATSITRALASNTVVPAPETVAEIIISEIAQVSVVSVSTAMREILSLNDWSIFMSGSLGGEDPRLIEGDIAQVLEETLAAPLESGGTRDRQEWAPPLVEGESKIISHEFVEDLEIHMIEFSNNATLNFKHVPYDTGKVSVTVSVPGGALLEPADSPGLAYFTAAVASQSGLGPYSKDSIRSILAGTSAGIGLELSLHDAELRLGHVCSAEDIELQLALLLTGYLEPRLTEDARTAVLKNLAEHEARLPHLLQWPLLNVVRPHLAGNDSRFAFYDVGKLKGYELEYMQEWLQSLARHSAPHITIAGDIAPETAIELVSSTFGRLPALPQKSPAFDSDLTRLEVPTDLGVWSFEVDTADDKAIVHIAWHVPVEYDAFTTRRLNVLAGVLQDRLRVALRDGRGDTYSPSVTLDISEIFGGYAWLTAVVLVSPGVAEAVSADTVAVAQSLASGIEEDEFDRALQPIVTSYRTAEQTLRYWSRTVLPKVHSDPRRLEWARGRLEDLGAMTVESVEQHARCLAQQPSVAVMRPRV
ncbi:Insulinase (Peptidase family M16) [Carpediemonas membranifera]|uniref:Insulinase (Peptidase family M16) n=1 Tax=Carpediemonas membranifera TaxID=201153 RepID=A0A8J6E6T8_9EUKA|nr:Insulinase (Peptidase family M16) [Carpediemonas membranifera]|eukprot:KAG9389905.1 Insulinase (Peptidase family M16) [Carpediemonas membranifera]